VSLPHQLDSRFNGFFFGADKAVETAGGAGCVCHTWLKPGVNKIASHSCSGQSALPLLRKIESRDHGTMIARV
jgi:hypothetical protein